MVIREATINDRVHIAEIWRSCFTDDENYIELYLNHCLPHTNTWILGGEDGRFYSCISVFPSYFIKDKCKTTGGYLYGVGTLPEHRGKSYSSILINIAVRHLKENGHSYFLVKPATEDLFSLYSRLGFDHQLFKSTFSKDFSGIERNYLIRNSNKYGKAEKLTATELIKLREDELTSSHFMWPLPIVKYILEETQYRNGVSLVFEKITIGGNLKKLYFVGYPDDSDLSGNTFKILETNASSMDDIEDIYSILRNNGRKEYFIKADFPGFGMENITNSGKEKSALFMELKGNVSGCLETLHLSLPLE
ncbi:MAG: hypothetical protein ACD_77C00371G0006 [uncultured bacterium]|nr:MAG: hypothetical protein ACD_77C00371G0006 [uncultured bacterium]HBY02621.1 hypothetical protein [Rikenellaceae bacterium]